MSNPPSPVPIVNDVVREQIATSMATHFHIAPELSASSDPDELLTDTAITPESELEPDFATKKAFVEQMINSVNASLKAKGVNVGEVTEVPITGPSGSPQLNSMFSDLKRIQREFPKIHGKHVHIKKRKSKRDKK